MSFYECAQELLLDNWAYFDETLYECSLSSKMPDKMVGFDCLCIVAETGIFLHFLAFRIFWLVKFIAFIQPTPKIQQNISVLCKCPQPTIVFAAAVLAFLVRDCFALERDRGYRKHCRIFNC